MWSSTQQKSDQLSSWTVRTALISTVEWQSDPARARREVDSRKEVESPGDTENDGLVWLKEDT